MDINELICPRCSASLPADAIFCPHCGNKVKDPLSTSLVKQVVIYFVSFFLAPFGLGYVFKYLKSGGKTERMIGYVALSLTIIAIGVELWVGVGFFNAQVQALHDLGL